MYKYHKIIGALYKDIHFYLKKREIFVNICNLRNISDELKPSNFVCLNPRKFSYSKSVLKVMQYNIETVHEDKGWGDSRLQLLENNNKIKLDYSKIIQIIPPTITKLLVCHQLLQKACSSSI